MRKVVLLIIVSVAVGYIGIRLESEQRTQAAGPTIDSDNPLGPLWPDRYVRYLIDPGTKYKQKTPSPLCSLHYSRDCELTERQGIILAAATYQEQTSLTFENESALALRPPFTPDDDYLRHDHPHLFFVQGYGGRTYSYTQLRNKFKEWRDACQAVTTCDTNKWPGDAANASVPASDGAKVGWTYARVGQKLMRPAADDADYKWPLNGEKPKLPHDDYLITIPDRPEGNIVKPDEQHYDEGALHEIGHALGMSHEQKRPDRDEAAYYFWCHVDLGDDQQAFENGKPAVKLSPYDIGSIMQYYSNQKCTTVNSTSKTCKSEGGQQQYPLLSKTWIPGFTINDPNSPNAHAITYKKCGSTDTVTGYYINRPGTLSPEDINILYQLHPAKDKEDWDNEPDDRFGAAIAAGDFDGDHYADLAVGAPGEVDSIGVRSGAVYVFKGTYTGLVPWRKLVAPYGHRLSGDGFGTALAAGDLDGDGYAELVVGAPQAQVGDVESGAAWLFDGRKLGPQTAQATALTAFGLSPAFANGHVGAALAIGNLDGLGDAEIAVGAPGRDAVYVFRSDGSPLTKLYPPGAVAANHRFGGALATGRLGSTGSVYSVNTPADLVIGAPGSTTTGGALYISRGGASIGKPIRVSLPDTGTAGDRFGAAVVTGRFSTAATTQVAVGAPGYSNSTGRVYVLSIAFNAGGITTTLHQELRHGNPGDLTSSADAQFGLSLAVVRATPGGLGALARGDGLVVGMPGTPNSINFSRGTVGFFQGSGNTTPTLTAVGSRLSQPDYQGSTGGSQSFGLALAAGDFNGQAGTELAIAVPGKANNTGAVWVALSGTPPTFGTGVLASNFATFLDQEHVYDRWPAP